MMRIRAALAIDDAAFDIVFPEVNEGDRRRWLSKSAGEDSNAPFCF